VQTVQTNSATPHLLAGRQATSLLPQPLIHQVKSHDLVSPAPSHQVQHRGNSYSSGTYGMALLTFSIQILNDYRFVFLRRGNRIRLRWSWTIETKSLTPHWYICIQASLNIKKRYCELPGKQQYITAIATENNVTSDWGLKAGYICCPGRPSLHLPIWRQTHAIGLKYYPRAQHQDNKYPYWY